jgi:N4-gp56 family major capsid protein
MINLYGDISPRTAGYASRDLLERQQPYLVLEKFGQGKPLPQRMTKMMIFRRYEPLDSTPNALQEGVTPASKSLRKTDVPVVLQQYGDRLTLTDVILDTHEDPVLQESVDILSEQSAQMIERVRFYALRAGTNVFYANGTSRSAVNTVISTALQRRIIRALKRQNARKLTSIIGPSANYGTEPVAPSMVGLAHPDVEGDVRNMAGFVPTEKYANMTPWENEIGKVEEVRYLWSTIFESWPDAGGAPGSTVISNGGSAADVYPILYIAKDAYGIVPLKGQEAITPMVVNPKPSDSDPLAQRGHVAWKSMQAAVILQDLWMVRAEVAASV